VPPDQDVPVLAVVGPTAAGKSDLAVEVALRVGGEVVNADSMQLYRGMDIGTAKLNRRERRGVPHHLLDVLDVTETSTVAEFQRLARAAVADCRARGVIPVVVGGSALYVRAVLDPFDFPGTDPDLRRQLEDDLDRHGAHVLHERLRRADPTAAAVILPTNARRIVRALEVIDLTGRPFTAVLPPHESIYPTVAIYGVDVPRDVLDERIADRVELMWERGFVDEVRALEATGLRRGRTAGRALGYAQILEYLSGSYSEEEAHDRTIRATRRFARRQDAWFRKDDRVRWLPIDTRDLADAILAYDRPS
jgi:tRNA dimethylallyltransferase